MHYAAPGSLGAVASPPVLRLQSAPDSISLHEYADLLMFSFALFPALYLLPMPSTFPSFCFSLGS